MARHTAFRDGDRTEITGEFVTRRPLRVAGTDVHRLLLEGEDGSQYTLFVGLASTGVVDFLTGATYRFEGVLGSGPVPEPAADAPTCPDCGGPLREGRGVDTAGEALVAAAAREDVSEPFGVVDEATVIHRVDGHADGEDGVDDWRPMQGDDAPDGVTPPGYVCADCGRHFRAWELGAGREGQRRNHDVADAASLEEPVDLLESVSTENTVGLAAGGAKDVENFRENVARGYTPQPAAISDEGLFYDYHFETGSGDGGARDALFAPRYATAVSDHPVTGERERYLTVGLDSTLSVDDFERPRLDLVAVLDVSGSMDSPFDEYYYDERGHEREADASGSATKMEAAAESLCALTEQLREGDRLGVVLYNDRAHVAKPLRDVGRTDMAAIRRHVREVRAHGGTNMEDGFEAALDLLLEADADPQTERRVVFMTDMMPNAGATGADRLTGLFGDAAAEGVHTTFVGMGLDANAELAATLSEIRGANHYFVHSAAEFERRLGEEFAYMVTPLVYDLTLEFEGEQWSVAEVHGSPTADAECGRLLEVGTLFPSSKQDGEARGGVVLARLEPVDDVPTHGGPEPDSESEAALVASWTERDGSRHWERVSVEFPAEAPSYDHDGVRKAVALARYARTLREWAREVHGRSESATGVDDWLLPDPRGEHERNSVPLAVPPAFADRFEGLRTYLDAEMDALGDPDLARELDLLETLCERAPARPTGVGE